MTMYLRQNAPEYVVPSQQLPAVEVNSGNGVKATLIRSGAPIPESMTGVMYGYGNAVRSEYDGNGTAHFPTWYGALGFRSHKDAVVPSGVGFLVTDQNGQFLNGVRFVEHPVGRGLAGSFPVEATHLQKNLGELNKTTPEEAFTPEFFGTDSERFQSKSTKAARWILNAIGEGIVHYDPGYVSWLIDEKSRGLTGFELTRFVRNRTVSPKLVNKAMKQGLPFIAKEGSRVETLNSISLLRYVPNFTGYLNVALNGLLGIGNMTSHGALGRLIELPWRFDVVPVSTRWQRAEMATEELAPEYFGDNELAILIASRSHLAQEYKSKVSRAAA
jgi:hypothetical protein